MPNIKLRPYQEKLLDELRMSDDPLRTFVSWESRKVATGACKNAIATAYIQELREALYKARKVLK